MRAGRPGTAPDAAVGARIAEARRSRALSQAALASAAALERTALSKIETGRRGVGSSELARIAQALGLPIEQLFIDKAAEDSMTTLTSRRAAILKICRRHGAHSPRLFGSIARGRAEPGSDVDLLVDMEPGRSLLDQAALLVELRDLLGRDVDVVTAQGLRDRIRARVLAEAISL